MILRIVKYVMLDILRGRIALAYTVFLLLATFGLFNLGGDTGKGLVSVLSIVLMLVPLTSLMFATVHFYNSYEFIELLSSQPLRRDTILLAEFLGVAGALVLAFLLGVGIPVLIYGGGVSGWFIVGAGVLLTFVFTALAFLGAVLSRDKARGIGVALLMWFFFALLYDGMVLLAMFLLQDYPLDQAIIAMTALNPIDLARTGVLLRMDVSALMGVTGAVMRDFMGSSKGVIFSAGTLVVWMALPLWLAVWFFRRKDL